MELGRETVRADEASLLLVDGERDSLVFAIALGGDESQKESIGQQVPMGEGLLGRGAEVGETKIGLPTYKGIHQAGRDGVNADPQLILSTPIFIGDEMIGAITALRIGTDRDNFDG